MIAQTLHRCIWGAMPLVLCAALPALAQYSIAPVALSGQTVPDGPSGSLFQGFTAPLIGADGNVAFRAAMETGVGGVTTFDNEGIWAGPIGGLHLAARGNSIAAGVTDGSRYVQSFHGLLTNGGNVFFDDSLDGNSVTSNNSDAIWAGQPLSLGLVARRGDQATGMPTGTTWGINAESFAPAAINSSGEVVFASPCKPSGDGLWSGTPGALSIDAAIGQTAPGTGGGQFSAMNGATIDDSGKIAFTGTLTDGVGGATSANDSGIWAGTGGSLSLVVRAGDSAPDMPVGTNFSVIGGVRMNRHGQMLVTASVQGPGITSPNQYGFWIGTPGSFHSVVNIGDQAPGVPTGETFSGFWWNSVGNGGHVVFGADLASGNGDQGLWSGLPGDLHLVAHRGETAPGSGGQPFYSFTYPSIGGNGAVAFAAYLGDSASVLDGIWAADAQGNLNAVAVVGQPFQVAVGDIRTVAGVDFPDELETGNAVSDDGTLVFHAWFTDGSSGIFTAQVPEPASGVALFLCAALLPCRKRRVRGGSGKTSSV